MSSARISREIIMSANAGTDETNFSHRKSQSVPEASMSRGNIKCGHMSQGPDHCHKFFLEDDPFGFAWNDIGWQPSQKQFCEQREIFPETHQQSFTPRTTWIKRNHVTARDA
jgi:hypothetical protein